MTNHTGTIGEPTKPNDARKRMGVFKRHEEVPDRYRLSHHKPAYEGRDVWAEFSELKTTDNQSESAKKRLGRAGRRWKEHSEERGVHHALASPADVETFFGDLLDGLAIRTVYYPYWVNLSQFYDWLLWHDGHPHVYDPVLMAAATKPETGRVWEYVIDNVR